MTGNTIKKLRIMSELIGKYMYTFILFPKMEVSKSFIL